MKSTTLYTPKRFFFQFLFPKKIKAKTKTNQIGCDAILFLCLTRVAMLQGLSLFIFRKSDRKENRIKVFWLRDVTSIALVEMFAIVLVLSKNKIIN